MNVVTRANREIMESNHTCCSQIVLHMGKETEQQVRSPGLLCRCACGNNNTHGECREVKSSIREIYVSLLFLSAALGLCTCTLHPCISLPSKSPHQSTPAEKSNLCWWIEVQLPSLQTSFIRDFLGFKNLLTAKPFNSLI